IAAAPKPIIARIDGACIGGGFELALLCDIRIAADRATFGVTPARVGHGYSLANIRLLLAHMSVSVTREILFTARHFPAEDALRWGVLNQVTAAEKLDAVVDAIAEEIAANAPLTVKAAKLTTAEAIKPQDQCDEALIRQAIQDCYESEDYREGQLAFAEKRKPAFKGR
ncbi:MAG TPA: enoyl-CoA hydratase, partial [Rhodospirillaceae bacterium]|nr:enoyl-CoA hydratase [Rhodospirillaceae bacterium]